MPKTIFIIALITLLSQLATTFYCASQIITENQRYQINVSTLTRLKETVSDLENEYSQLSSLHQLYQQPIVSSLVPISNFINLSVTSPDVSY